MNGQQWEASLNTVPSQPPTAENGEKLQIYLSQILRQHRMDSGALIMMQLLNTETFVLKRLCSLPLRPRCPYKRETYRAAVSNRQTEELAFVSCLVFVIYGHHKYSNYTGREVNNGDCLNNNFTYLYY